MLSALRSSCTRWLATIRAKKDNFSHLPQRCFENFEFFERSHRHRGKLQSTTLLCSRTDRITRSATGSTLAITQG